MLPLLDFNIPWEQIDDQWYGMVLEVICLIYSFFGLALVCDEHMVPALDTLCVRWGISEDVAGATFMAFGSAAPEIIINVVATIQATTSSGETASLGVSAIIGSGMIAFSLIPAACGIFATQELMLKRRPLLRDEFFYITSLCILTYIIHDGTVYLWEAGLLVANYVCYLFVILFARRARGLYWRCCLGQDLPEKESFVEQPKFDSSPFLINEPEIYPDEKDWKDHLTLMGFPDFIDAFESEEWNDPNLWYEITVADFNNMGINKRGRIAKFRRFLKDPYYFKQTDRSEPYEGFEDIENCGAIIHSGSHNDDCLSDEEEHEHSMLGQCFEIATCPLNILFDYTCPDCEIGHRFESWYMLTFIISIVWVALFSFVLSSVVERWVALSGLPMTFFGLILVSLGAEIPDTIESVSVARKGYGSMAVSNCQGTQVINICIGLGLTWCVTTATGGQIHLDKHLMIAALFQMGLVFCNIMLLLGVAVCTGADKAVLNKKKSVILIVIYLACIGGFGYYLKATGQI